MRHSIKTGVSFGLTSGIITTIGLMVGLYSGTQSDLAVIGGILTIAIADSFSDALGIHIAEEAENIHSSREIWESTFSTFISKFCFAMIFVIPLLLVTLSLAIIINVIWGLFLLGLFSFIIAKEQNSPPWKIISEHIAIALIVITAAHFVGEWISSTFG